MAHGLSTYESLLSLLWHLVTVMQCITDISQFSLCGFQIEAGHILQKMGGTVSDFKDPFPDGGTRCIMPFVAIAYFIAKHSIFCAHTEKKLYLQVTVTTFKRPMVSYMPKPKTCITPGL